MNSNRSEKILQEKLQSSFEEIILILKSLGTPNRLKILILLLDGPKIFQELKEALDLGSTALSNHLSLLKKASLIDKIHHGYYRITNNGIEYLQGFVSAFEETQTNEAKEREILQRKQMMDSFLNRRN
ncbi:MAG TPA: ArsR family transcriptional regulator [candidate division Zixibacteria bacterium]|nr:ArsR family transcriptional regulator [candidate division Zixibacteria bacterium]